MRDFFDNPEAVDEAIASGVFDRRPVTASERYATALSKAREHASDWADEYEAIADILSRLPTYADGEVFVSGDDEAWGIAEYGEVFCSIYETKGSDGVWRGAMDHGYGESTLHRTMFYKTESEAREAAGVKGEWDE